MYSTPKRVNVPVQYCLSKECLNKVSLYSAAKCKCKSYNLITSKKSNVKYPYFLIIPVLGAKDVRNSFCLSHLANMRQRKIRSLQKIWELNALFTNI